MRFQNSKNVVSLRKTVDECKSCWFANLFSNFLILRALKQKKSTKNKKFNLLFIPIIFKNFMKISIFHFYMTIETKTNIYSQKWGGGGCVNTITEQVRNPWTKSICQLPLNYCGTRRNVFVNGPLFRLFKQIHPFDDYVIWSGSLALVS